MSGGEKLLKLVAIRLTSEVKVNNRYRRVNGYFVM